MGLDVYCGALGRYLSGNWTLIVQQRNSETAMSALSDDTTFNDEDKAALQEVLDWRDNLNRDHLRDLGGRVDWPENLTAAYRTDKPGWEPYLALLLWAGKDASGLQDYPEDLPHNIFEEPGFDAIHEFGGKYQDFASDIWLPKGGFDSFIGPSLDGEEANIGSTYRFFESLNILNQRTWQADDVTLAKWRHGDENLAPDPKAAKRLAEQENMHFLDAVFMGFEANARFGFAIFHELAKFAAETGMPMILDS